MYTTDDCGLLNNYATEPAVYFAEYPSEEQQQGYAIQAAISTLLLTVITLIAFSVS